MNLFIYVVLQVFVKLLSSEHLVIVFKFSKKDPATRRALKAKLIFWKFSDKKVALAGIP